MGTWGLQLRLIVGALAQHRSINLYDQDSVTFPWGAFLVYSFLEITGLRDWYQGVIGLPKLREAVGFVFGVLRQTYHRNLEE